ncbi:MAG TPA: DUF1697 domain-containing protein [Acidimicrobiales bacterium]
MATAFPATWVALLRAVNLGKVNRLAMADLRASLEALGYGDVRTLLQSGNALFTATGSKKAAGLEREIADRIKADVGLGIEVVVLSGKELASIVDANPFAGRRGVDLKELGVAFLSGKPADAKVNALDANAYAPEEFAIGDRVVYVRQPSGIRASKLPNWERALDVVATARNWNTTLRLRDLADG